MSELSTADVATQLAGTDKSPWLVSGSFKAVPASLFPYWNGSEYHAGGPMRVLQQLLVRNAANDTTLLDVQAGGAQVNVAANFVQLATFSAGITSTGVGSTITFRGTNGGSTPGLRLWDTDDSHTMRIALDSDLTANRTFLLVTGNGNRTLDLSVGSVTFSIDGTFAANSDTLFPSQKAIKTYVDTAVTGLWDFKGAMDCSANPNYPAALKGDAYVVSVAGKIGGASGTTVAIGDVFVASADNAGGTQASVGSSWFLLEHNLVGAMLTSNNLSDVANAATARANLGVAIGADVQAWSADLDGALLQWTNYTPTVTPASGSFTTTSTFGRYKKVGKTVHVYARVTITTNGTASGSWSISLPFAVLNITAVDQQQLSASEVSTGVSCSASIANNTANCVVRKYDGSYIGANGYTIVVSGAYEAA